MKSKTPVPGISRDVRISDAGLQRLERLLQRGGVSKQVLDQWIKRYGDAAKTLIERYRTPGRD